MLKNASPKILPLSELLRGRLFSIPEYQRPYSWQSRQRQALFEDIKRVHSKGSQAEHFMATVVCLKKEPSSRTDGFEHLDIVDGQQRLTTLIVLLNAIKLACDPAKQTEDDLKRKLEKLLFKEDGVTPVLRTNHDTRRRFTEFLRNGTIASSASHTTDADRELKNAMVECNKFVSNDDIAKLPDLEELLMERLFFLFHDIEDETLVYSVFEVLNSRGLAVSWLDRLKSNLMGAAFEMKNSGQKDVIQELHDKWRDIYKAIGLRTGMGSKVLQFAATLWTGGKPTQIKSEEKSVNEVFHLPTPSPSPGDILEIADWLLKVTEAYDEVSADPYSPVAKIGQARLLATSLRLKMSPKQKELQDLLVLEEKITFRIYVLGQKDVRKWVGDYVQLAWRVVNESQLNPQMIKTEIRRIGQKVPISEAINSLKGDDWYNGWKFELRYFMFKYEEHLTRKKGGKYKNEQWSRIWMASPTKSIEHIWAQRKAPEKFKHNLGNLMILSPGLNSQLQDQSPLKKAKEYRETGLLLAIEVATMVESVRRWSSKSIRKREDSLLKWAEKEWGD